MGDIDELGTSWKKGRESGAFRRGARATAGSAFSTGRRGFAAPARFRKIRGGHVGGLPRPPALGPVTIGRDNVHAPSAGVDLRLASSCGGDCAGGGAGSAKTGGRSRTPGADAGGGLLRRRLSGGAVPGGALLPAGFP